MSSVVGGPPRKLRVVYLDHVAQLSGGELALLRLLQVLSDVDAHVILAEEGPLADRLLKAGISVEVFPMNARTRKLPKDSVRPSGLTLRAMSDTITYAVRLARRLRQLRPEIVHTNSLKSGIYGSIAARLAGRPVIWHLRDQINSDYLPPLGVLVIRALTRHLPDVVISNSSATRQTLRARERSLVIPSVVEMTPPHSQPPSHDHPFVVGIVGRLAPWKGQDVFLHAFARAFPNGEQRAMVVGAPLFGDAETEYAKGLRRVAHDLGIASRVEFRGHRDDIASELRNLNVLVHASTKSEPFGQVVIEGMSAQLPVVASRGGGPEEIITHGVNGLLYPRGDIAALAELLLQLEAAPQLRERLGRAAARRARDFDPHSVAAQIMRAYELAQRYRQ